MDAGGARNVTASLLLRSAAVLKGPAAALLRLQRFGDLHSLSSTSKSFCSHVTLEQTVLISKANITVHGHQPCYGDTDRTLVTYVMTNGEGMKPSWTTSCLPGLWLPSLDL